MVINFVHEHLAVNSGKIMKVMHSYWWLIFFGFIFFFLIGCLRLLVHNGEKRNRAGRWAHVLMYDMRIVGMGFARWSVFF